MIFDETITRWHPDLAEFIQSRIYGLPGASDGIFEIFCVHSREEKPRMREVLRDGTNPRIDVKVTRGKYGYFDPKRRNEIVLARNMCVDLRRNPASWSQQLLVEATILHELVHWINVDREPRNAEWGNAFEMDAYGRLVTNGNA